MPFAFEQSSLQSLAIKRLLSLKKKSLCVRFQVGELKGGDVEVGVVCLSHDGTLLGVGLEDGSVVLWDLHKQTSSVTLK